MGGNAGMGMVGRGHQYGIDGLAHLVEHHSPVLEPAGIGIVVKRLSGIFPVHIAQGHNVLRAHLLQIATSHSAHAHSGNVQFVTWRHMTVAATQHHIGHYHKGGSTHSALLDEISTCDLSHVIFI